MIRYTLLGIVIAFLCAYAWRDWYRSLCALILMMAVIEHPEMPNSMLGIPGLNPWNLLLLSIMASWVAHRGVENLKFDFPRGYGFLLSCYALVIVIGFVRCVTDMAGIYELYDVAQQTPPGRKQLLLDNLLNSFKWAIPGLLLFTGARTQERQHLAVLALIGVCVLLGLQVVRWMPLSYLSDGGALSDRAIRVLDREIGYHRVDLAAMTAGGFWAIMNYRAAIDSRIVRLGLLGCAAIVLLGLALTGGRAGYGTWAALGMFFAVMHSRKYLIFAPIVAFLVFALVPAAQERLSYGFNEQAAEETLERFDEEHLVFAGIDLHSVTSGRALAWPYVVRKIGEAPFLGHGQMAMQREGVALEVALDYGGGASFPHPHNAYLELLLDNGIIGALPILLFFFLVVKGALRSLSDRERRFDSAVAAATVSFIGAQMIASIGSQSFYPKAGTVVMFCAIGLQLRLMVQRAAERARTEASEPDAAPARRRPGYGRVIQGRVGT